MATAKKATTKKRTTKKVEEPVPTSPSGRPAPDGLTYAEAVADSNMIVTFDYNGHVGKFYIWDREGNCVSSSFRNHLPFILPRLLRQLKAGILDGFHRFSHQERPR